MTEKLRTEEWIHIQNPDGTNMIASPNYIRKLIGVDAKLDYLQNQIDLYVKALYKVQEQVFELEKPDKVLKIKELLKNGPLNTLQVRKHSNWNWLIVEEMIKQGLIIEIRSKGQGRPRIYQLPDTSQSSIKEAEA